MFFVYASLPLFQSLTLRLCSCPVLYEHCLPPNEDPRNSELVGAFFQHQLAPVPLDQRASGEGGRGGEGERAREREREGGRGRGGERREGERERGGERGRERGERERERERQGGTLQGLQCACM